ncbi:MAG: hypothetical protein IPJ81_15675 [Chitinophagaceae bacterium]|nr:hypothetical protein [Chitinophagaceae bacterium]
MHTKIFYKSLLLLIIISSCITRHASIDNINNTEYKRVEVSNISFFENINFDTVQKSKSNIALFYNQNNKLEFLEPNVKSSKKQRFYFFEKEGSNILVSKGYQQDILM